jgi:hypothetical protein
MKDISLFKKFNEFKEAIALTEQLKKAGIQYELKDEKPDAEITSANDSPEQKSGWLLLVDNTDFDKVTKILEINTEVILKNIDENHYLFEFTNEELIDILMTPDKWGKFDYLLAQKILIDRGEIISSAQLMAFRQKRLEDLAQPDKRQIPWIIGYADQIDHPLPI